MGKLHAPFMLCLLNLFFNPSTHNGIDLLSSVSYVRKIFGPIISSVLWVLWA